MPRARDVWHIPHKPKTKKKMKKSDSAVTVMTAAQVAQRATEQAQFVPALALVAEGEYEIESTDNGVNVYDVRYYSQDGQERHYCGVALTETGDIVPLSAFAHRAIQQTNGQIVQSTGFYQTAELVSECVTALNASSRRFRLTHVIGAWVGGRRNGRKPVVTPITTNTPTPPTPPTSPHD